MVRARRESESVSLEDSETTHVIPLGVPFYLSCPIDSYHAHYTWEHRGQRSPCLQMQSNCLHLIPVMTLDNYGEYKCISEEKGYTNKVKNYLLTEQIIPDNSRNLVENDVSAVVPQLWISLGWSMVSAVMGMR